VILNRSPGGSNKYSVSIKSVMDSVVKPASLATLSSLVLALPAHAAAGKLFDFNLTLPVMAIQFLLLMVAPRSRSNRLDFSREGIFGQDLVHSCGQFDGREGQDDQRPAVRGRVAKGGDREAGN